MGYNKDKYITGYGIQGHLKSTLDHVKHPEGKSFAYTFLEEGWSNYDIVIKVCKKLEKQYPNYLFWPEIHFFEENIKLYDKAKIPNKPLVELK